MFQTKNNTPRTKLGAPTKSKHSPGQLSGVKNRGGRASQLGRQQSVRHTMDDLVEPPPRSGKSRRGSLLQQVGRRQQQPMNEKPSSQIEESGRTRSTPLPTRSPPRRGRSGRSLPIIPSRLHVNDDDFLDSPRRSPRGLGSNRVVTSRSDDFINSLRRSPRGLSNNRVQRSLEPEYNASNAGQMQRHHQVQHQSNQLYNTQVSSSSRQQPLGLQHQNSRSSSSQRQSQTPSNGAPLGNRNILQQNPSCSEPQQNDTPEDQHLPRKKRGRSLYEGTCQIGGKYLNWIFMGGDYVSRTGEDPEEAIKKIMRNAYNMHRNKIYKAYKKFDDHEVALAARTTHFGRGLRKRIGFICRIMYAKAKEIYYGAGNEFTCFVCDRFVASKIAENKPCDAVILFSKPMVLKNYHRNDLDVEGQNDEDDYVDMEDNFIRDNPDMEHRNVEESASDDE
ncbi:hypothetical protein MKW92_038022 [Papaver armeniacum]|nr:hypothetical protein MKW92_038022 [Papaver armeniacum]